MAEWFGASWATVGFVALSTAAMYASALVTVRLAGRRTLAQMSAFDALITIAIGSLIATTAMSPNPSYAQGVTALVTLLVMQVVLAWIHQRFPRLQRLLTFVPLVLARDGTYDLPRRPTSAQVTVEEVRSRLRAQGVFDAGSVRLVVLEPNGEISIVPRAAEGDAVEALGDG